MLVARTAAQVQVRVIAMRKLKCQFCGSLGSFVCFAPDLDGCRVEWRGRPVAGGSVPSHVKKFGE